MFRKVIPVVLAFSVAVIASMGASAAEPHEPVSHQFCFTCHGTDGMGSEGIQAPRLAGMEPWYLKRQLELFRAGGRGLHPMDFEGMEMQPMATQLKNFKAGYRGNNPLDAFGAPMRAMTSGLADDQAIIDVVSYINTLGR